MKAMTGLFLFLFVGALEAPSKSIALSFDDAPRSEGPLLGGMERAKMLKRALAEADATAVFFIVGKGLLEDQGRERIQLYSEAGHLIANHSFDHPHLSKVTVDEYMDGLRNTDHLISKFKGYRKWFRYPYLDEGDSVAKRDFVRNGLNSMGYTNAYVTIDNADWHIDSQLRKALGAKKEVDMNLFRKHYLDHMLSSVEHYDALAVKALGYRPVHMLLLHENDTAALFLGDLITELRSRGWHIVHPDKAYEDPLAQRVPDTLVNNNGRIFAIASSLKLDFKKIFNPEEMIRTLDQRFSESNIARK